MHVGEKIKSIREERELSQIEFADSIGVSQSAVNYWENGKREPKMSHLCKISSIYNIPITIIVDEPEKISVGERIRKIRKEKGFTQKSLGQKCGINEVQIRHYEIGKSTPKISTVEKIAAALDVPVTELLFEESPVPAGCVDAEMVRKAVLDAVSQNPNMGLMDIVDLVISRTTSAPEPAAMKLYSSLNEAGKQKAEEYLSDLAQMPKYQQEPDAKK